MTRSGGRVAAVARASRRLTALRLAITLRPVRALLAAAAILLVLATEFAPHTHQGPLGRHACVACTAAAGEEAACASPDVAPARVVAADLPRAVHAPPVTGAPLGAVPGQSPPAA